MATSCPVVGTDPTEEYRNRRVDRHERAMREAWRERIAGNARVGVFLLTLLVGYLALGPQLLHPLWLVPLVVLFVILLFVHESITRAWYRAQRSVTFYNAGLARLADDWKGKGQQGLRFLDNNHPYAADLDLFGPGSLFELLCTARTRTGEDTLANWLKAGAGPDEVRARQLAVIELRPQLDLREDLALLGSDLPAGVDFDAVVAWGKEPAHLKTIWLRWVAMVLGVITLFCLLGWVFSLAGALTRDSLVGRFFDDFGSLPLVILLLIEAAFMAKLIRPVNQVLEKVERRGRDLAMLSSVLARLEQATFISPRLVALHKELTQDNQTGAMPSQRIASLGNLIDLLQSRRNQLFAPFALILLWGTQVAFAVQRWRSLSGPAIETWLRIVGEFEALCALAAYAFENPKDPFPEIVDQGPCFEGQSMTHPLLPRSKSIPNHIHLGHPIRVLLVSGSNMSGKSTYLRTIGINAVLALAGAPVRAESVRLSPLAVGATLRIQDSLQEGKSRFYAEILRVRQIVDLSRGPVPLLFLLDEIFAGTNSHDRCVGAEAVVIGLVKRGAIGLVTTHDLTLTKIAERLGEVSTNVHFADHFEDGQMHFDYTLRQGVVENSNALALMRAVGLEV